MTDSNILFFEILGLVRSDTTVQPILTTSVIQLFNSPFDLYFIEAQRFCKIQFGYKCTTGVVRFGLVISLQVHNKHDKISNKIRNLQRKRLTICCYLITN